MTTTESMGDIAVTVVDTDVHPLPVSAEVLKSYAPAAWKDKLWPTGNERVAGPALLRHTRLVQDELASCGRQSAGRRCRGQ